MTATLDACRRFFAEEVEVAAGLKTAALVDAFATVPRERFLGPGPWLVKGVDGDFGAAPRPTRDAEPRRVYHNVAIAIDPARQLFNGQPGTVGRFIDELALAPGARVLHVGAGTGYYTALIAHCVGDAGRVVAVEADADLARFASDALGEYPQVEVRHGDATVVDGTFDAILVNAGATHPLDAWLEALGPAGRIAIPVTFSFGGAPITKGIVALISRWGDRFDARVIGFVGIYAAVGVRDDRLNPKIAEALKSNPMPRLTAFRRDPHEPSPACWLHADRFCFQLAPAAG